MKVIGRLKRRVEALLTAPGEELGRWARLVRFQIQLWRFCARRLRENNALAMSSALSFRTVFAMVPVFVLIGLAMKTGGALEETKREIRQFIVERGFSHIVQSDPSAEPAPDSTTQPEVTSLADKIELMIVEAENKLTFGTVGPVGVVLLIWSALTLLTTMERSLNRIFGAPRSRSLVRRLLLYWSAVTLAPLVLAAAALLGGRAAKAFQGVSSFSWMVRGVAWAGPVLIGILLLAALYKMMPNTKVSFRSALGGALVAVPLWLLAKWGFSQYVASLVGRPTLYGALGLLPLFLLWLNFSWLIFLFGAQLAHTAANLTRMQSAELADKIVLGPWELLAAAVAVAQPYRAGRGPVAFEQVAGKLDLPGESVHRLIDRLTAAGVICPVESDTGEAYLLARPAEQVPVLEFLGAGGLPGEAARAEHDVSVAQALARLQGRTRQALGTVTLADLLAEGQDK